MTTVALHPSIPDVETFQRVLASQLSGQRVIMLPDVSVDSSIEIIVIWKELPDSLADFPALKLIMVCGAGVDGILEAAELPPRVLLARIVDPVLQDHVSDYIVMAILIHSRQWNYYMQLQREKRWIWNKVHQPKPKVGLMGLGYMGGRAAYKLQALGYEVCGWVHGSSNNRQSLPETYRGRAELLQFAQQCGVIVCALPLTGETAGILNRDLFDHLPHGTYLINVGRGGHLVEHDLIHALGTGQLSGACLDTFETEPLPEDHPFWTHPDIVVTPHIAGILHPASLACEAGKMVVDFYQEGTVERLVDFHARY